MSKEFIMPKNEQKEDEEIAIENKDGQRKECELFKKEAEKSREESDRPYVLHNLVWEGAENLIKKFGVEKFADAIREVEESDKPQSMYEVIKVLEPDKEKRQELYKEALNNDEALLKKSGNIILQNDIRIRIEKIKFFKYLDSFSSFPEKSLLKMQQMLGRDVGVDGETHFDFKNLGADFKERLIEYDGDLERLMKNIYQNNRIKKEELGKKRDKIVDDLRREIEQINIKLKNEYLKENKDLIEKLEETYKVKPVAEFDVIDFIEKTVEENYKNVEKEIDELTKKQKELIGEIRNISLG